MWKKISQSNTALIVLAGVAMFLAFPRFELIPTVLFFPFLVERVISRTRSYWTAFGYGYLLCLIILLGGFYWVTYVIHVFGELPWSLSILIFLGFCLIGAINFPVFLPLARLFYRRLGIEGADSNRRILWMTLILPALYTLVECLIPKLFPWSMGHCLFRTHVLIQIAELTGITALSFGLFSLGGALALIAGSFRRREKIPQLVWMVPGIFWGLTFAFGYYRLAEGLPPKTFNVALIQGNIGSIDKVQAEKGLRGKVRFVVDTYERLTEQALKKEPKPDLVLWPETAMPFQVGNPISEYAKELHAKIAEWKITLITGTYAPSAFSFRRDHNAAILVEPLADGSFHEVIYAKNILLAFGEYLPFGDMFPVLYRYFPQVADFERGRTQDPVRLNSGLTLGVTICYEAIVPSFFRKVTQHPIQAVVNLTNDSWFGPTAEPHLHGALTVFRAIESRVPLMRVTNTGLSFTVDTLGRMSDTTKVYEEGILNETIHYPDVRPLTLYTRFGDWFAAVCSIILVIAFFRYRNAPIPV